MPERHLCLCVLFENTAYCTYSIIKYTCILTCCFNIHAYPRTVPVLCLFDFKGFVVAVIIGVVLGVLIGAIPLGFVYICLKRFAHTHTHACSYHTSWCTCITPNSLY